MPERGDPDFSERARWQQIETLLDAVLDLPAAERAAYLREACGTDVALRDEVLRIIEAGEREETLPLPPIGALASALIRAGPRLKASRSSAYRNESAGTA